MVEIQHFIICLIFHKALVATHLKGGKIQGHVSRIRFAVIQPEKNNIFILNVNGAGQHPVQGMLVLKPVDVLPVPVSPFIQEKNFLNEIGRSHV